MFLHTSTAPAASRAARTGPRRSPRLRAGLLALLAALATLALAAQANATVPTINVNPSSGLDTNRGTVAAPVKTLTRALRLATAGTTVRLAAGGYGAGFSGVRNLNFGDNGFGVDVFAKQDKQTLSNLRLGTPAAQPAVIDGIPLRGGIFLRGTAQITLSGSTIALLADGTTGVSANEQARFTMDGGSIAGGAQPNCNSNVVGVELNESAQATLKNINNLKDANSPDIQNIAGTALAVRGTSKATLSDSGIFRALTAGCAPRPSVTVDNAAALTVIHSVLDQRTSGGDANAGTAIAMGSSAPLALPVNADGFGSSVSGYATAIGVVPGGTGSLAVEGANFTICRLCVDARDASGAVAITDSSLRSGLADSVGLIAPKPKVRGTEFVGTGTGILVTGTSADLGTTSDPGNNLFHQFTTGVQVDNAVSHALISAEGNTWEANVQSADASGHYTKPLPFVSGASSFAKGANFDVRQGGHAQFSVGIDLASAPVGRLRVTPRGLHTRPGGIVNLVLSWTHPKSWQQLRTLTLRVYRAARVVGVVVIRPHSKRLTSHGAVALVANGSRLTRRGKTVTARLSLKLSSSLAGKDLRLAVQATDRHGHSQLEAAGAIHITN